MKKEDDTAAELMEQDPLEDAATSVKKEEDEQIDIKEEYLEGGYALAL